MVEARPSPAKGEITSVATLPPAAFVQQPTSVLPSSHVMNSTPPFLKADEFKIGGTFFDSHVSPVDTEQSCMSLHRFGVTHMKFGTLLLVRSLEKCVYGTTPALQRVALVRISL